MGQKHARPESAKTPSPLTHWGTDAEPKDLKIELRHSKKSDELCKYFAHGSGHCPFGESCRYRHVLAADSAPLFMPTDTLDGTRTGFEFKSEEEGRGYYAADDAVPSGSGSSSSLSAATIAPSPSTFTAINCPVCLKEFRDVSASWMNNHIDICLSAAGAPSSSFDLKSSRETKACSTCHVFSLVNAAGLCSSCATSSLGYTPEFDLCGNRNFLRASDPFALLCPYPECAGTTISARNFRQHINVAHSTAHDHRFSCPVCQLMGNSEYSVDESTNLLKHVNKSHTDLMAEVEDGSFHTRPLARPVVEDGIWEVREDPSLNSDLSGAVGTGYLESAVTEDMDQECEICLEEFTAGEITIRMECLCLFHKNCIADWFERKGRQCPLHTQKKDE